MSTASTGPFEIALLAIAALAWIVCLGFGIRELQLANHVLRSRPNSVVEAPGGGPVELRGTAEPVGRALRSPFAETACVAYEYEVEEERNTKNGRTWATIHSGERYVPFRLNDGSGSVLIEPPGADFRFTTERRLEVDGGDAPPEPIRRFIAETEAVDDQERSVDLRLFELRTGKDRRFVERRLDVGETAHVLGTARYDSTSKKAGDVNAAVGIGEAALSERRSVRIRHRLFGYPFVISDRSERAIGLRALAFGVTAIAAGSALVVWAVLWAI